METLSPCSLAVEDQDYPIPALATGGAGLMTVPTRLLTSGCTSLSVGQDGRHCPEAELLM